MMRLFLPRCWLVVGLGLGHTACALDRGEGFSTLEVAELEVSLESEGDSDDGTLVTDAGYTIVVERATMRVSRMELQELASGADSEPVEEEEHGHEHADDAHAEPEHEDTDHAPAAEAFAALVTVGFDEPISMTEHRAVAADSYAPSRQLGQSSPRRVLVVLGQLEVEGVVSGGELDGAAELVVDLPLDIELHANLEPLEIDHEGPESVRLVSTVHVPGSLFDEIDFSTLAEAGHVVIDDPDTAPALGLTTSLAGSDTHASLE